MARGRKKKTAEDYQKIVPDYLQIIAPIGRRKLLYKCLSCGVIQVKGKETLFKKFSCSTKGCIHYARRHYKVPHKTKKKPKKQMIVIQREGKKSLPDIPERLSLKGCILLACYILRFKDWDESTRQELVELCGVDYDWYKETLRHDRRNQR